MKLVLSVTCLLLSHVSSTPVPQDFDEVQLLSFDEENLHQQGSLSPQGFTQQLQPQQRTFKSIQQSPIVNTGASVLRYVSDVTDSGYKFVYELSDGTIRSEEGAYKDGVDDQGTETKILVVQGAYSFIGPDGETYWTKYEADEKGYRPETGKGAGGVTLE